MGEIDRINPILRPQMPPKVTDRVQPGGDRRNPHHQEDSVELKSRDLSEDDVADEAAPAPERQPEHGLDLSI
jgi:hypothetical protein